MKSATCAAIGAGLGIVHGLLFKLFIVEFATASYILYGDTGFIPVRAILVMDVVMLVPLLTSSYWVPYVERALEEIAELIAGED